MVPWNYNLVNAFPDPYKRPLLQKNSHTAPDLNPHMLLKEDQQFFDTLQGTPFPFFKLPPELRNRIYTLVLFTNPPYRQNSPARPGPCASTFLVSKRFHKEASYQLYSTQPFRIFPLQDFNALPTVRELPAQYRNLITTVELVLGPSWTAPPNNWKVNKSMARILAKMEAVQMLKIFVEIDPTHPVFAKFRVSHGFYTEFSGTLVKDILAAMPGLEIVLIEGRPSVQKDGPLISRVKREVEAQGKLIEWGEIGSTHSDAVSNTSFLCSADCV